MLFEPPTHPNSHFLKNYFFLFPAFPKGQQPSPRCPMTLSGVVKALLLILAWFFMIKWVNIVRGGAYAKMEF